MIFSLLSFLVHRNDPNIALTSRSTIQDPTIVILAEFSLGTRHCWSDDLMSETIAMREPTAQPAASILNTFRVSH
jgi:hypothetical protein